MKLLYVWVAAVIILTGLLLWFLLFNPTATPTLKYSNGVVVRGDCEWLREEWEQLRDDTNDEVCESVCLERFCPYGIYNETGEIYASSTNVIGLREGRCWEECFR